MSPEIMIAYCSKMQNASEITEFDYVYNSSDIWVTIFKYIRSDINTARLQGLIICSRNLCK